MKEHEIIIHVTNNMEYDVPIQVNEEEYKAIQSGQEPDKIIKNFTNIVTSLTYENGNDDYNLRITEPQIKDFDEEENIPLTIWFDSNEIKFLEQKLGRPIDNEQDLYQTVKALLDLI